MDVKTMRHILIFLFCVSVLAGCSHPRHETLVYYYPVTPQTNNTAAAQAPQTTAPATAVANQAPAAAVVQASPTQITTVAAAPQQPVNITTLYPAALPYTGVVRTYSAPAPEIHLFFGPSFGFWHHRYHYRHYPYRRYYYHRGHRRWR